MSNKTTAKDGTPPKFGSKPTAKAGTPPKVGSTFTYMVELSDGKTEVYTSRSKEAFAANLLKKFNCEHISHKVGGARLPAFSGFKPNGHYLVPLGLLETTFENLSKKIPDINRFAEAFDGNADLPTGNPNYYPVIICSIDNTGVNLTFTFRDAKGDNVHIILKLDQAEAGFNIREIELWTLVNGGYTAFTINIDPEIFDFTALLTKEQVLDLCFSFLGELMLLKIFDFFLDTNGEAPYDRSALFKLYLKRNAREFTIKYNKRARTFTIGSKDGHRIGNNQYGHITHALKLVK